MPADKRQRGYYALPLLWRDRVVGWGNLAVRTGVLHAKFGYVDRAVARDPLFKRERDDEVDRMRVFLGLDR